MGRDYSSCSVLRCDSRSVKKHQSETWPTFVSTLVATLGSLTVGYAMGYPSSALIDLANPSNLQRPEDYAFEISSATSDLFVVSWLMMFSKWIGAKTVRQHIAYTLSCTFKFCMHALMLLAWKEWDCMHKMWHYARHTFAITYSSLGLWEHRQAYKTPACGREKGQQFWQSLAWRPRGDSLCLSKSSFNREVLEVGQIAVWYTDV